MIDMSHFTPLSALIGGLLIGTGVVLLGSGIGNGAVFVIAMLVGKGLFEWLERQKRRATLTPSSMNKPT